MTEIPDGLPAVVATGPLTSDALAQAIGRITGETTLYFYDAASPIVDAESIDRPSSSRLRHAEGGVAAT